MNQEIINYRSAHLEFLTSMKVINVMQENQCHSALLRTSAAYLNVGINEGQVFPSFHLLSFVLILKGNIYVVVAVSRTF
jgi:hypothetical protein